MVWVEVMWLNLNVLLPISGSSASRDTLRFKLMDADHGELPITTGDGTTSVTARFIKGVDKRATITRGWSNFFRQAHMNKGQAYAFAFKCTSKGLRLIVYSITFKSPLLYNLALV
ncbi:hypothetical protein ACQJBY_041228 [Aegilops geniculata]